jgi:hypothetical protein
MVPPDPMPAGWAAHSNGTHYNQQGGSWEKSCPPGSKPLGVIALADAISDMRAMTSLNLASNSLGVEGAKIIAAVLPKCT